MDRYDRITESGWRVPLNKLYYRHGSAYLMPHQLCRPGGTVSPLSKKRTKWQSRQRQGRGARSAPGLHEKCGQKPTPRWAFLHTLPHESIVSVFCPHERTVRESSILRRCRILSNPSLFLGHSTPLIQASFSALPTLCRVLFNKRF